MQLRSFSFASILLTSFTLGACGPPQGEALPPPPPLSPGVTRAGEMTSAGAADGGAVTAEGGAYSGLGQESVSPELLAKFAPKPLPSEVSRRIEATLDIRSPGAGLLTPDGKTMFIVWSITGVPQVFRIDGPKGFPVELTGGEDPTLLRAISPDAKWLAVTRDRKGEENPGIYLLSPTGGPLKLVSHKPKVQSHFELFSDDSKYVYYTTNEIKADSYALYRYEIESGNVETLFTDPGLWSITDHTDDGRILFEKATGALSTEFYEWDPKSKALTPLLGQGETEEWSAIYGAAPGELVVAVRKNPDGSEGEFRRAYRYQIKDKKLVPITEDLKMDARVGADRVKRHVYLDLNDGGYDRTRVYDARTWKQLETPVFPGAESVWAGSPKRDGKALTFFASSSKAPSRSYVYEWDSKKVTEWTLPSAPEIDTTTYVKAELETFPARDGTKVPMFVRRPKTCQKPCPVVVQFHGGPEGQATPGFSPYAQLFVDAGFVFVEPNVRGSDGYGRTYLHADDGKKRLSVITDIEDVSKYIRSAWAVEGVAPKVGVTGGSYGGYSTLIAMTMFAGAYDAGVANVGISNLLTFLQNTAPYRRSLRISEYGDPVSDHDALVALSPVTYVDRVKSPLMLIQGASDPRVPVGEAIQMHDALTARGVDTKLIVFPDEGHGAQKRENRVIQTGATLDFFEVHLLGKAPSFR